MEWKYREALGQNFGEKTLRFEAYGKKVLIVPKEQQLLKRKKL